MASSHASTGSTRTQSLGRSWARWANLVIGAWIVVSAFIWPHTVSSRANTFVTGAIIAVVALGAMAWSGLRALNMLLAVWLFSSSLFLFRSDDAASWHNAFVAALVFTISILPSRGEFAGRPTATSAPPI